MQIRRTLTPDHAPTGLDVGQLSVEMASDPPKLWVGVPSSIDPVNGRLLLSAGAGARVAISDLAPTAPAPQPGDLWFNSTDLQTYIFYDDGTSVQWVPVNNTQGGYGIFVTPADLTAALAGYLLRSGGTMTGMLSLAANAGQPLEPVSLQQMTAALAALDTSGTGPDLSAYLLRSGGAMTGALTLAGDAASDLQAVPLQQLTDAIYGTPIYSGPSAPATPAPGDLWYDTVNLVLKTWNGAAWVAAEETDVSGFMPLTGGIVTGLVGVQHPASSTVPAAYVSTFGTQTWWSGAAVTGQFQITDHSSATTYFSIEAGSHPTQPGSASFYGTSVGIAGTLHIGGGIMSAGTTGFLFDMESPVRSLGWYPGWSDTFDTATGLRSWNGATGTLMSLDAAGDLSTTGAMTPGSDAALKHAIEDYDGGIDIARLRPRYFRRHGGDRRELGFVHQELKQIADELAPVNQGVKGLDPVAILAAVVANCQQLAKRVAHLEGAR